MTLREIQLLLTVLANKVTFMMPVILKVSFVGYIALAESFCFLTYFKQMHMKRICHSVYALKSITEPILLLKYFRLPQVFCKIVPKSSCFVV